MRLWRRDCKAVVADVRRRQRRVDDEVEIVLQINGKIRDKLVIPAGLDKDATQEAAMQAIR